MTVISCVANNGGRIYDESEGPWQPDGDAKGVKGEGEKGEWYQTLRRNCRSKGTLVTSCDLCVGPFIWEWCAIELGLEPVTVVVVHVIFCLYETMPSTYNDPIYRLKNVCITSPYRNRLWRILKMKQPMC